MSIAKDLDPTQPSSDLAWSSSAWNDVEILPSDLYSDEPPLETDGHLRQMILLIQSLECLWRDRQDFYATGNLTIYYSPEQIKPRDFRGPDFFVVLNTECKLRKSWVVWAEGGKFPNVIVEVLSESTAKIDRGLKKQLYQDIFHTPEYFWVDPVTLEFEGFIEGVIEIIFIVEKTNSSDVERTYVARSLGRPSTKWFHQPILVNAANMKDLCERVSSKVCDLFPETEIESCPRFAFYLQTVGDEIVVTTSKIGG